MRIGSRNGTSWTDQTGRPTAIHQRWSYFVKHALGGKRHGRLLMYLVSLSYSKFLTAGRQQTTTNSTSLTTEEKPYNNQPNSPRNAVPSVNLPNEKHDGTSRPVSTVTKTQLFTGYNHTLFLCTTLSCVHTHRALRAPEAWLLFCLPREDFDGCIPCTYFIQPLCEAVSFPLETSLLPTPTHTWE